MNSQTRTRRRGTVLLMVVSLLALLFVIVTGFLAVVRFDAQIVEDIARGDQTEGLLDSVDDMAIGLIGDSWRDPATGRVMGGPAADGFTIPGYGGSYWLSSGEPVWNEGLPTGAIPPNNLPSGPGWADLLQLTYPAISAFEAPAGGLPVMRTLVDLIPEFAWDLNALFTPDDVIDAARQGWMDADGDGVPDTDILHVGIVGEQVNALADSPVRVPNPGSLALSGIPSPMVGAETAGAAQWRRYLDNRRYDVAVRVVSHGGMVTLNAPRVWNPATGAYVEPVGRRAQIRLFESLANSMDTNSSFSGTGASPFATAKRGEFFDELAAYAPIVEANLRNRYFLPGATRADDTIDVPRVLAVLQGDVVSSEIPPGWGTFQFPNTMVTSLAYPGAVGLGGSVRRARGDSDADVRRKLAQRINLADSAGDLLAWRETITRRPAAHNSIFSSADPSGDHYDIRHLTTTINNSDDLALKQNPAEPTATAPLATWRGEQKFYLGEVNKAFTETATGVWEYDAVQGPEIIKNLARIYRDMLASHGAWSGQAVPAAQQATMLAVNTVAFASPRDSLGPTPGWIDPVTYKYTNAAGVEYKYIGYAPQPFITEAILHRADGGGGNPGELALAVELFNPQDPYYDTPTNDVFALNLSQFRIRVRDPSGTDPNVVPSFALTNADGRFDGRQFGWAGVEHAPNSLGSVPTLGMSPDGDKLVVNDAVAVPELAVQLLRVSKTGAAHVVDEIQVDVPAAADEWSSSARDTRPARNFGYADYNVDGIVDYARWSMVANEITTSGGTSVSAPLGTIPNAAYQQAGGATYDPDLPANIATPQPFGPETPLITMNATPGVSTEMFDNSYDLRPNSFPTVGFMLFIPRFSHVTVGATAATTTIGDTLADQSTKRGYAIGADGYADGAGGTTGGPPPVDMGHMPIFENTQPVLVGSYLSRLTGGTATTAGTGIPWGQLVFEYFTTLNPEAPGVDPLKVPGRININAAPWYVLSKLPMLAPYNSNLYDDPAAGRLAIVPNTGVPTAAAPSPAFWDPQVGVLVGSYKGPHPLLGVEVLRPRLLSPEAYAYPTLTVPPRGMPHRQTPGPAKDVIGAWLAQAATAYRDGIQVLPGAPATGAGFVYADAHLRGVGAYAGIGGAVAAVPYRPLTLGPIRGQGASGSARPTQFGFITVGELANVKGFDSTLYPEMPPASLGTTRIDSRNGDFVKAVSLLALLDTQNVTVRSNTFTVYTSLMDRADGRENSSVRSQVTVDRSNQLPRLSYAYRNPAVAIGSPGAYSTNPADAGLPRVPLVTAAGTPVRTDNDTAAPMVISQRRGGYFNSTYDN
jgi:hypothetical protein